VASEWLVLLDAQTHVATHSAPRLCCNLGVLRPRLHGQCGVCTVSRHVRGKVRSWVARELDHGVVDYTVSAASARSPRPAHRERRPRPRHGGRTGNRIRRAAGQRLRNVGRDPHRGRLGQPGCRSPRRVLLLKRAGGTGNAGLPIRSRHNHRTCCSNTPASDDHAQVHRLTNAPPKFVTGLTGRSTTDACPRTCDQLRRPT
jgi:hypothetical protein